MHFTAAEITAFIGSLLWPFFRIGAMLMAAPIFGAQTVPARVRLGLAALMTVVVAPLLPAAPAVDPFSLASLVIIVHQVIIGAVMGLALQLVFSTVVAGAQIIAMQMGLGFAEMVDPANGQQTPVLGQFYMLFTTLVFLAMNGHLLLLELLVESFLTLPVGPNGLDRDAFYVLAGWGTQLFAGAVWLALPAVASLLVVNAAFGVMSRAAPQLNIFSVGFPVAMIMGFAVLLIALQSVTPQFTAISEEMFGLLRQTMGGGG
jgi:flagellar biosynthetic protein FliR